MRYVNYDSYKLSALALGTVQLGLEYGVANKEGKPSQGASNEIISYVSIKGINCLDTAQAYGNSEEVVGVASKDLTDIHIISKVKSDIFRNEIIDSVELSLKKLYRKKLFALLLHDSRLLYDWRKEDSNRVNELKEKGYVEYFGVSIYTCKDFELALENKNIDIIQIPYNIFDQRALDEKWFEKAEKKNKLIFIRSIYLQGLLLMEAKEAEIRVKGSFDLIKELDMYCNKLGLSRNELAFSFVNSTCRDSIMLFGCETIGQAKENIEWIGRDVEAQCQVRE